MAEENNGFVSVEATGIYEGTLIEDMIETVKRTGKLLCDVDLPDVFGKDFKHPYVHVPLWAFSLPLRKGDKVQVIFNQEDFLYPMLYKNPDDLPDGFLNNFEIPEGVQGGNITMPKTSDTVSCHWLGDDSYLIKTDDYTVLHQGNGFILITNESESEESSSQETKEPNDKKSDSKKSESEETSEESKSEESKKINKIYIYGDEINLSANGKLNIDCSGDLTIKSLTGVTINNHLKVLP